MTAVLSYVNKGFSIILSDNRINYGHNQEAGYDDGFIKLINLPQMGWVSGAGLHDFLEKVKERLANADFNNIDDIIRIFMDVIEISKRENPLFKKDINSSVVVSSWLGMTDSDVFFRVGILSNKHYGNGIELINNGEIRVVYPGDYLDDLTKVDYLEGEFDLNIGEKDFNYVLSCMLNIFEHISSTSKQVSKTCDIGVYTFLQDPQDGVCKFTFSGEVNELISELRQETLFNRFKAVSLNKFKFQ